MNDDGKTSERFMVFPSREFQRNSLTGSKNDQHNIKENISTIHSDHGSGRKHAFKKEKKKSITK